jgi:multidrug efflux pump subunit AcrA (membrane-fusion protein)
VQFNAICCRKVGKRFCFAVATLVAISATAAAQVQPPRTPGTSGVINPPGRSSVQPLTKDKLTILSTLKYVSDIDIAAQADGLITKLAADEGVMVRKDEPLIQMDIRLAQSELDVAAAELRAAEEQSKDTSEIDYSKAAYDVAKIAYDSMKTLLDRNAASESEAQKSWLESERSRLAIKVAELKHNKDLSQSEIAKAKRDAANVQIQLRSILAPFDGVVVKKDKDEFEWVRAGEPIMRLVAENRIRVIGSLKASELRIPAHKLKGAKATLFVELAAGIWDTSECTIGFVSSVVDLDNRYRIWAEIDNKQQDGQWVYREGMVAQMELANAQ